MLDIITSTTKKQIKKVEFQNKGQIFALQDLQMVKLKELGKIPFGIMGTFEMQNLWLLHGFKCVNMASDFRVTMTCNHVASEFRPEHFLESMAVTQWSPP